MDKVAQGRRPYIGVTGFMTREEVVIALGFYREAWKGREPTHDLMVGVLASSKTLCLHTASNPLRYPAATSIAHIFIDDPLALNLVHVCTNSDPSEIDGKRIPMGVDALRGLRAGGALCHGIQVNSKRPGWRNVQDVRATIGPDARFVLQAHPQWLDARLRADNGNMDSLLMFGRTTTDILIDVSGGRGKIIDGEDGGANG